MLTSSVIGSGGRMTSLGGSILTLRWILGPSRGFASTSSRAPGGTDCGGERSMAEDGQTRWATGTRRKQKLRIQIARSRRHRDGYGCSYSFSVRCLNADASGVAATPRQRCRNRCCMCEFKVSRWDEKTRYRIASHRKRPERK